MDIGRVQRRFTAEPAVSPVPGVEAPITEPAARARDAREDRRDEAATSRTEVDAAR